MAGVGDLFGGFLGGTNWGGIIQSIGLGAIIIVVIGAAALGLFFWLKNKMTFKTPVSLIMVMANGTHKRRDDLMGGQVKGKDGIQNFVVKIPKQFKIKPLGYIPDYSLADGMGRLVFITQGDGMVWQQCVEKVITEKEVEVEIKNDAGELEKKTIPFSLIVEPIPTDIKTITINNIHAVENIMEANKLKAAAIIVGGFILMVFVQIIFLFLTSK